MAFKIKDGVRIGTLDVFNNQGKLLVPSTGLESLTANGNITIDPDGTGHVEILGTNGIVIPVGTTAQQGPNVAGAIRLNSSTGQFEGYSGTNWASLGGVRSIDGQTYISAELTPGASDDTIRLYTDGSVAIQVDADSAQFESKLANINIAATTVSSSTSTGALTVAGGVGIAGALYVGGLIQASSAEFDSINDTPVGNLSPSTGAFTTLTSNGATTFTANTASTSSSTGAVVVTGGLGVGGNINVGGNQTITGDLAVNGADITTTDTGTATVFNTNATTVNAFGAATNISIGTTLSSINLGGSNSTLFVGGTTGGGGAVIEIRGDSSGGTVQLRTNQGVTTASIFDQYATTINAFRDGTAITIGATTGTTTIRNANTVITGDLAVNGGDLTTNQTTFNLINTTATTGNLFGEATAVNIGAATGTTTIKNNLTVDGDIEIKGGDLTTNQTTVNLLDVTATTVNFAGAATTLNIGHDGSSASSTNIATGITSSGATKTINIGTGGGAGSNTAIYIGDNDAGVVTLGKDVVVIGDLTVNGITTTLNSVTLTIDDKNIELGAVETPTNITAEGGGFTLKAGVDGDKTLNWAGSTTSWTSSENIDLAVGKVYKIGTTEVLAATTLFNTQTSVSLAPAGTTIEIGAATGTTNINNDLDVDGDVNIDGGDLTTSATTFNLLNATATTVNFAGAGTAVNIGAATGTLTVGNPTVVGTQTTQNLFNTTATTVNFAGAATDIQIGAATGTTNINNDLDVDGDVNIDGGDLTTSVTTFNLLNTTATTVNFAGAGTAVNIGAVTGTTSVKNDLSVDGNIKANGNSVTLATAKDANSSIFVRAIAPSTITGTTAVVVDSWPIGTYRTAKYTIQVKQANGKYQSSELLVVHNGTTTNQTEYAVVETNPGSPIPITFTSAINGSNVELASTVTDANTNNADILIQRTLFVI
jgi:hypothetical protein